MRSRVIIYFLLPAVITGCRKEYENPPYQPVNDGATLSIRRLKSRVADTNSVYRFAGGDTNLYCTVIADETGGNIYRQVFVRDDEGGAIEVNLKESGGLFAGDRIRINLNRLYVVSANSMISLDSVDLEQNVVKLSSGHHVNATAVNLASVVATMDPRSQSSMQSQLVDISGVEFVPEARGRTFGDVIGKTTLSFRLRNCMGNEALVRTSGYASFAGKTIPSGNGNMVAIVTQYKNEIQLLIRNYGEVKMNGQLCVPTATNTGKIYVFKDFNDASLTSGGWTSYTVTNSAVKWSVSTFSSTPTPFGRISGFVGGVNTDAECWLISPPLGIASASNVVLTFQTAAKFTGMPLELLACTSYTGGLPGAVTWTPLPGFTLSPNSGSFAWTASGAVPLNAYRHAGARIAFRYRSTAAGATTYELDEIVVREN